MKVAGYFEPKLARYLCFKLRSPRRASTCESEGFKSEIKEELALLTN